MKPFIVICDGMDKAAFAHLCSLDQFEVAQKAKHTAEEIEALLPRANALVIRSATKVTADTLEKAPHLKYVIRAGEGTDNIDKVACEQKGVKVSNTPGANNNSAAEHAIALMMTVLRKTAWAHQSMAEGRWDKSLYTGNELLGKEVGIVGFGRIGQILAKRISGFEPKVHFYDPFVAQETFPDYCKCETLEEIFSTSDILTVHTPLNDHTKGLINSELLSKMKPGAVLINAARGKIVDEDALLKVLSEGKIRGAGFDVFANEPLDENSPLRKCENLVLTPHLGASTEEAQVRVAEMAINQLNEFFHNNNLLNEVKA